MRTMRIKLVMMSNYDLNRETFDQSMGKDKGSEGASFWYSMLQTYFALHQKSI